MPPKIKTTKEDILEAAFRQTREKGIEHVNARELAKALGCSTQPIFRAYENMEELKKALYQKVDECYSLHMMNGMNNNPIPFLGLGLAYIEFASKEKNLFKLMFLSERYNIKSLNEMIMGEDNDEIITMISQMASLSVANSKQLYLDIWLTTHGIATMMATNSCDFNSTEIQKILNDAFKGFLYQLKNNKE